MGYISGPVNSLTDFQVEFNGFLMGAGTSYGVPPLWDFLDLAPIKTMDEPRIWADGSWSGPDYADVLTPTFDVEISGTSDATFAANVAAFRNAFTAMSAPAPLWVKLPQLAPFGIPAKVSKRAVPVDITWGQLSIASLQFRVTDPVWQSVVRSASLTASASALSGMVFPLFNWATGTYATPGALDFGSTVIAASAVTLTNAGNAPAWPYVVVTGPCPGGFTLILDGNQVVYGQDVASAATVVVDYKSGTAQVSRNTPAVDRTYVLTSRQFTPVNAEGSSIFLFSATSGTAVVSTADMWR
jgi:hypothetical protein